MIILEFLKMPKSRRDRTIALTRTSKKQGIEHKEKVDRKNNSPCRMTILRVKSKNA